MPQDNKSSKLNKKFNKLDKKREELNKKKKRIESSDSSDNDDETIYSTDEDEMDVHEYRKFLKKNFPSGKGTGEKRLLIFLFIVKGN